MCPPRSFLSVSRATSRRPKNPHTRKENANVGTAHRSEQLEKEIHHEFEMSSDWVWKRAGAAWAVALALIAAAPGVSHAVGFGNQQWTTIGSAGVAMGGGVTNAGTAAVLDSTLQRYATTSLPRTDFSRPIPISRSSRQVPRWPRAFSIRETTAESSFV